MISLKNRLILIYSLFFCVAVLVMSLITNLIANNLFSGFVKQNIKAQSERIVETIEQQYTPGHKSFNLMTLMALGMSYVHQGYIISIEDMSGNVVWDARECDMQQCANVISSIEKRMQDGCKCAGKFQNITYPLHYMDEPVGYIHIETYSPFFYSESELSFVESLNKFLVIVGVVFTLLSIMISCILAATLSKPILKAAQTAKIIAGGDLSVRIPEKHRTKELRELSRSVNELAAALENGERWQKRLTSDIAHELRTPLTTLQGNVEAMMDGIWEPTQKRLACCHEEIVRLNTLVEDLGLLSILEQEGLVLHKTRFDLSDLLSALGEQLGPVINEKGLALRLNVSPCPVFADFDRLKQVFINLLSNAVKYTDGGSIDIESFDAGNDVEVRISDTGIGIHESDLPHIFERFYRSDKSRSRITGGAGIGLTVASSIIEAHGGKIGVSSVSGNGSVFSVTLPKNT